MELISVATLNNDLGLKPMGDRYYSLTNDIDVKLEFTGGLTYIYHFNKNFVTNFRSGAPIIDVFTEQIGDTLQALAEGSATESYGTQSHSEGQHTTAYGNYSHAEGFYTTANAEYSHAEGRYTNTNFKYETVVGNSNSADELFGPTNASPYFQVGVGNGNQANGLSVCSDSNTYIPINGMQTPLNSYAQRTLDIQLYMLTTGNPALNYSYYSKNGLEVGNMAFVQGSSISLSTIASKLTSWNGVDNIIARRSTDITESTAPLGLNIKTDDGFLDPFIPISLTVFPTINTTASAHPITINFTNSIASAWLVAIYAKSYAGTHTGTTAANIWTYEFEGDNSSDYRIINFMTNIASAQGGTKILYINGAYSYK
jgi:hypothetical protein